MTAWELGSRVPWNPSKHAASRATVRAVRAVLACDGGSSESRTWSSLRGRNSSREGVERGGVLLLLGCRFINAGQLAVALMTTVGHARRPVLDLLAAAALAGCAAAVAFRCWRADRLLPGWLMVDVAVGTSVLLMAPAFLAPQDFTTWAAWPYAMTLLTGSAAAAALSARGATLSTVALSVAYLSWLLQPSAEDAVTTVLVNVIGYPAFAIVVHKLMAYLRALATLADAHAETIRLLEEERTRRVLHTPYRLLHDLSSLISERLQSPNHDVRDRARLAEALASAREIEALVRGTGDTSNNLADELRGLEAQFIDLPLVMNVDGLAAELPPSHVQTLREAVRSTLQNVRLHASAEEVVVFAETIDDRWLVSVHDDGIGFNAAVPADGIGLSSLVLQAVEEIGGAVSLRTAVGEGTHIIMQGPLGVHAE